MRKFWTVKAIGLFQLILFSACNGGGMGDAGTHPDAPNSLSCTGECVSNAPHGSSIQILGVAYNSTNQAWVAYQEIPTAVSSPRTLKVVKLSGGNVIESAPAITDVAEGIGSIAVRPDNQVILSYQDNSTRHIYLKTLEAGVWVDVNPGPTLNSEEIQALYSNSTGSALVLKGSSPNGAIVWSQTGPVSSTPWQRSIEGLSLTLSSYALGSTFSNDGTLFTADELNASTGGFRVQSWSGGAPNPIGTDFSGNRLDSLASIGQRVLVVYDPTSTNSFHQQQVQAQTSGSSGLGSAWSDLGMVVQTPSSSALSFDYVNALAVGGTWVVSYLEHNQPGGANHFKLAAKKYDTASRTWLSVMTPDLPASETDNISSEAVGASASGKVAYAWTTQSSGVLYFKEVQP